MKAIIVGSGVSGLMSAALLAENGWEVTVCERADHIGGVTALAEKDGFRWEQGPLLLGDLFPGEDAARVLAKVGIHLEMIREDRGIVLPDYEMWPPSTYEGPYWRRDRLKQLFPQEASGLDRYYRFYDDMLLLSRLGSSPKSLKDRIRVALAFLRIKPFTRLNAQELMNRFFRNPKLQALYLGILADFCVAPSEFSGIMVPFVNIETAFDRRIPLEEKGKKVRNGFGYIRGSVNRMVTELVRVIQAKGGILRCTSEVDSVVIENKKALGVRLASGEFLPADVVIGSGGAREFFEDLVGMEHLSDEYRSIVETFRPMESVFMIHLGVDFDPLQFQPSALCYYYGTYDIESAIRRLREGIYHHGQDGFLIYVPSKANPELAPKGFHCVTLYTVAPDSLKEGDWETIRETCADELIALAERRLPGLSSHIRTRLIRTPLDYREIAFLRHSAFGGTVPDRTLRNPPHRTPVDHLFFVGAQSETRGGITGCLIGADETVGWIIKNHASRRK